MEILEEAKRYLEMLDGTKDFLENGKLKRKTLSQGDYTFAGIR